MRSIFDSPHRLYIQSQIDGNFLKQHPTSVLTNTVKKSRELKGYNRQSVVAAGTTLS